MCVLKELLRKKFADQQTLSGLTPSEWKDLVKKGSCDGANRPLPGTGESARRAFEAVLSQYENYEDILELVARDRPLKPAHASAPIGRQLVLTGEFEYPGAGAGAGPYRHEHELPPTYPVQLRLTSGDMLQLYFSGNQRLVNKILIGTTAPLSGLIHQLAHDVGAQLFEGPKRPKTLHEFAFRFNTLMHPLCALRRVAADIQKHCLFDGCLAGWSLGQSNGTG